jgi:hypothetical protein
MSFPSLADARPDVDGCTELRAETSARCEEAHAAGQAHTAAIEWTRALKRDLVAARHQLEAATSANDPALRRAEKEAARDAYLLERQRAGDDDARRQATGAWASAVDRINRRTRLAGRAIARAASEVSRIEADLRNAERSEQAARFRAESAEAGCLDARVRLAACEEGLAGDASPRPASPFEPHAATGGHAVGLSEHHAGTRWSSRPSSTAMKARSSWLPRPSPSGVRWARARHGCSCRNFARPSSPPPPTRAT